VGGFPEPFLNGSEEFSKRWRRSHIDRILREDLLDLEKVRELKSIEILVDLLADRVGSTISYSSLARDLEVSPKTVKHWVEILERMYVIFVVPPYAKNLARAILKEPKIYFYDIGRVKADAGARFENLIACHLLKRGHFLEDTKGDIRALHYVRDQQGREADFLTLNDRKPEFLIEAKVSDPNLSASLTYFSDKIPGAQAIQLVQNPIRPAQFGRVEIRSSAEWLRGLEA
jgi:predicted AAA+ superfamily ATPase